MKSVRLYVQLYWLYGSTTVLQYDSSTAVVIVQQLYSHFCLGTPGRKNCGPKREISDQILRAAAAGYSNSTAVVQYYGRRGPPLGLVQYSTYWSMAGGSNTGNDNLGTNIRRATAGGQLRVNCGIEGCPVCVSGSQF
jgi:hypothetical protein